MPVLNKISLTNFGVMAGKLTGVLVVTSSLINSSVDIYRAINNIPTSQAERDNKNYYQRYFGEKPIFQGEVPLATDNGRVTIGLEVHSKGDILVKYGTRSQWFPFPTPDTANTSLGFISSAYAQSSSDDTPEYPTATREKYMQYEYQKDGKIIRSKFYPDGQSQTITIDPTTGNVSKSKLAPYIETPQYPTSPENIDVYRFPEIDVSTK
ncbi:hypothetical protein AHAT_21400 [Agarivorans sp. Toyoura001]|uniref:hypothetical protein n=1 Tax=Agarivorans sp. Toyoura001 TaxID=2283141 RepID=UPI0010EDE4A4|nr:hypothetical protein [Agarivorans sp. Toyoura001]GDY26250.1 hypothetical protein AHAT_21400 [Agarivorans sp. Toyoura001]